jgi:thioesterase domain-containing protein/aryl carrier-like protein
MKNVADLYPLTPMQELMLVHGLTASGHNVLINQAVFDLEGELDPAALRRAWTVLVERHSALRSAFVWQDLQRPMQVVRQQVALDWHEDDWRGQAPGERQAALDRYLATDHARGFVLNDAPLMRVALFRQTESAWVMVWTSHHLILDRWCINIVLDQVRQAYADGLAGRPFTPLPAPAFRGFMAWWLKQDQAQVEAYWRQTLDGLPVPGRIRGAGPVTAGPHRLVQHRLSKAQTDGLRGFAQRAGLPVSTVVTGATAVVLAGLLGERDVALGLTVSGRPPQVAGIETMVGTFINDVPLRAQVDETPLVEWLRRLGRQQAQLQDYAHVAPARLLEWSARPTGEPLFELLFLYQPPVDAQASWPGLRLQARPATPQATFPLILTVEDLRDDLALLLSFDPARLTMDEANDVLARLARVVESLVTTPEPSLSRLLELAGPPLIGELPAAYVPVDRAPDDERQPHQPTSGFEARLAAVWSRVLELPNPPVDVDFFDLGGTSLRAMQLLALTEAEFGRPVPLVTLLQAPTISQFAAQLSSGEEPHWRALIPIQTSGDRPPFFGVHHGGGGIYGYADLARRMGPQQPVYAFQELGSEPGQTPLDSVEAIARLYVDELVSVQPRGPYHLGGFCFGGVVAYEMAHQLQARGETVGLLALIDAANPNVDLNAPLTERVRGHRARLAAADWRGKVAYVAGRIGRRVKWEIERRYLWLRHHATLGLYAATTRLGHLPRPYVRQYWLLQHNGRLQAAYRARPWSGPALIIRGRYPDLHVGDDFGWNQVIAPAVRVRFIETGNHLDLLNGPNSERVAEALAPLLAGQRDQPVAEASPGAEATRTGPQAAGAQTAPRYPGAGVR